jgi:hypothetical protein
MQQRKLERDACCLCVYPVSKSSRGTTLHNFILSIQDSTIQIYSEFNLVWAAKV